MSTPPTGPGWPPPEDPQGYRPPGYQPPSYPPQGYPPPGYQQPGYQQPSYPPPGYQQPNFPPPGYQQPGYPPPGYQQQPAQGYPPPGYPPQAPMALQPGVIPLRPLTLGDIFNGAVAYIRANPAATLGLTAIVVIITQAITLILQVGPLAELNQIDRTSEDMPSAGTIAGLIGAGVLEIVITFLATTILSGMLTVVIGRAIFGSSITIREAWDRIRDRILPLIGLSLLLILGMGAIAVVAILLVAAAAGVAGTGPAVVLGFLLGLPLFVAFIWFAVNVMFAPVAVVLERKPITAAISRSFALVRGDFWRVFGIWVLSALVAGVIGYAVAFPFGLASGIFGVVNEGSTAGTVLAALLVSVGTVIGQIITTPFSAGVTVLLYTDRRIRAEAFDLVLRTGAAAGPANTASTDHLWLTQP